MLHQLMKHHLIDKFTETLRNIEFPNYMTHICIKATYEDSMSKFIEVIN